ncbi:uncharacterized protein LOC144123691 [Amblyomma americanum]
MGRGHVVRVCLPLFDYPMDRRLASAGQVPDRTLDGWPSMNEEATSARPAHRVCLGGRRSRSSPNAFPLYGSATTHTGHSALAMGGTTRLHDKDSGWRGKHSHGSAPTTADSSADLPATATPPTKAWPVGYSNIKKPFCAIDVVSAVGAVLIIWCAWPTTTAVPAAHRCRRLNEPLWATDDFLRAVTAACPLRWRE